MKQSFLANNLLSWVLQTKFTLSWNSTLQGLFNVKIHLNLQFKYSEGFSKGISVIGFHYLSCITTQFY